MRLLAATVTLIMSGLVASASRHHGPHNAENMIVSHAEASSTLFIRSSLDANDPHRKPSTPISFKTLSVISSSRSDHVQKKVQQTHLGLPVFGHSFVIGERRC